METETMGRVITEAKIENIGELWMAQKGLLPVDQVHQVTGRLMLWWTLAPPSCHCPPG